MDVFDTYRVALFFCDDVYSLRTFASVVRQDKYI